MRKVNIESRTRNIEFRRFTYPGRAGIEDCPPPAEIFMDVALLRFFLNGKNTLNLQSSIENLQLIYQSPRRRSDNKMSI